jgi:hypothetical protein
MDAALATGALGAAARRLVAQAVKRGGPEGDNVSVAVARLARRGRLGNRALGWAVALTGVAAALFVAALLWPPPAESPPPADPPPAGPSR